MELDCGPFRVRFASSTDRCKRKQRVELTDAIKMIRDLSESGLAIDHLDYSVKFSKLAQVVQRLSGLVKLNNLEVQTMPGFDGKANRLRENLSKLKEEKDSFKVKHKVALARRSFMNAAFIGLQSAHLENRRICGLSLRDCISARCLHCSFLLVESYLEYIQILQQSHCKNLAFESNADEFQHGQACSFQNSLLAIQEKKEGLPFLVPADPSPEKKN